MRKFICLIILISGVWLSDIALGDNLFNDYEDQIEKTFKVKKGQLLYLKSDLGAIEVESWNRNEVKIIVTKRADKFRKRDAEEVFDNFDVSFDQDSRGVRVRAEYTGPRSWFRGHRGLSVHFDIMVPDEFDLDIQTAGGSIQVSDLEGEVNLNTSGGYIKTGRIGGPVNARSSGGYIAIEEADGKVDVHTSGGRILVGETSGSVNAKTSGGGITLEGVGGDTYAHSSGGGLDLKRLKGNVEARTSGGGISAEVIGKINRECTLKTSGGGIKLYLPRDTSADIDAHTSGGRISTDFPITVQGKIKSNTLMGKINNGGPLIYLRTSGGNIYINEL